MSDLVPSISLDMVVARRDSVVKRVRELDALTRSINDTLDVTFGGNGDRWTSHRLRFEDRSNQTWLGADDLDKIVREIDAQHWRLLMDKSGLLTFMDAKARNEWEERLRKGDVPPLTMENIEATFSSLHAARGDFFERGVVACFRSLSWDYKTNTPVKFGKRIVLTHMIDAWRGRDARWAWARLSYESGNRLDDLVRVMSVLDGKPEPDHRQSAGATLRDMHWPGEVNDVEVLGLFRVRGFKNGNTHLTFLRLDLVDKMNAIVAKHHPNALPPRTE